MCITPFKKVPLVITTASHENSMPSAVFTPFTLLFSITISFTESCQKSTFGVCSSALRHSSAKSMRSFCVRGLHIAGPLLKFSIRYCIAERSDTTPLYPPKASISLIICPLATPPMAGLQDICPILFMSIVMSKTLFLRLAAAAAASFPACPAPTTTTL